jgi:hypothetical protein
MINATANLLHEPVGSMFATELLVSVMANSTTTLTSNLSTLASTMSSTERDVTEFPDYTLSSSLAGDSESYRDNGSNNCTNDYCMSDEDYLLSIENHIFPTTYEWIMIALNAVVFVVGLVGNALVCVAVYRNHSMRTVTNYFIVNLAVADFMVIFFCLPPTVVWDVTETWFLGTTLCKIVVYFQVGHSERRIMPYFVIVRAGLCPWDNRGKANCCPPPPYIKICKKKKLEALQYCDSNEFIELTAGASRVLMSKAATNNICSNKHKA